MITEDKIEVYRRFNGAIDSWARSGSKKEKSIIDEEEWYIIDGLIQDLSLVKKGLTSFGFSEALDVKFKELCASNSVVNELQKLVLIIG